MVKNISYKDVLVYTTGKLQTFSEAKKECRKLNSIILSTETLYEEPVYSKIKDLEEDDDLTVYRVSSDLSNCFGLIEKYFFDLNEMLNICPESYNYKSKFNTLCEQHIETRIVENNVNETIVSTDPNNVYVVPLIVVATLVVIFICVALLLFVRKKYFPPNRQVIEEDGVDEQQANQVSYLKT